MSIAARRCGRNKSALATHNRSVSMVTVEKKLEQQTGKNMEQTGDEEDDGSSAAAAWLLWSVDLAALLQAVMATSVVDQNRSVSSISARVGPM